MRRTSLALAMLLASVPFGAGCERHGAGLPGNPQVVVLGFDGMDPVLLDRFRAAGRMPNVDRLAEQGEVRALATTTPAVSAVAWTTFATGLPPSEHGVLGLVARDPKTYRVVDAAQSIREPTLVWGFEWREPEARSRHRGARFWERADRGGSRAVVLRVPYAFPPVPLEKGRSLSGMGVPDVRLEAGRGSLVASAPDPEVAGAVRVSWNGSRGRASLPGLQVDGRIGASLDLSLERTAGGVRLTVDGERLLLEAREWSELVRVRFRVSPFFGVAATLRFLLESTEPLRLYVSAPNLDPLEPYLPLSWPATFAGGLALQVGEFETLGWGEPTGAYQEGTIDGAAFLSHVAGSLDWMRRAVLHEIDQRDAELVVAVFTESDRVSHMFYREMEEEDEANGDVVEHAYRALDRLVEDVRRHLPAGTRLLIVSDHGFAPFRWQVSLNAWLEREGLQVRRAGSGGLADVDWTRTSAYALGLGQVYLNLRGREGQGVVSAGAESEEILGRIERGLAQLLSPEDGQPVVAALLRGKDAFAGRFAARAPDLLVQFRPGYRSAFADGFGGTAADVLWRNDRRWSGDHGGARARDVPGVLLSNRRLAPGTASLLDVAPTVLEWLGQPVPLDLPGRSLARDTGPDVAGRVEPPRGEPATDAGAKPARMS